MKVFTYSEARQKLATLLEQARTEEVIITRKDGSRFQVVPVSLPVQGSPFDIEGVDSNVTTEEILQVLREGRER